jgi:hypothetical protein
MEAFTAFVQLLCFFVGNAEIHEVKECLKTHTQQECQQIMRDKK